MSWIILSKYVDHLPLHRIADQFKRWGGDRFETTMIGWIAAIFELLGPIHKALEREIKTCGCMHVDETTLKVQKGEKDKRGVGKTSVDYLWAMLGRGPDRTPIGVSFLYDDGRSHAVAKAILSGVTGSVLTDGYDGYAQACKKNGRSGPWFVLGACAPQVPRGLADRAGAGRLGGDQMDCRSLRASSPHRDICRSTWQALEQGRCPTGLRKNRRSHREPAPKMDEACGR
ncbi:MAG: transposase [Fibrobacteres bacterium]|nr:transposase [Fibrobacterota bacterium]